MILYILLAILLLFFLSAWICYLIAFARSSGKRAAKQVIPENSQFITYGETLRQARLAVDALDSQRFTIRSWDGLTLQAHYYQAQKEKGLILLFHGYRSNPRNDFACAILPYLERGYSLLLVSQRAAGGESGGAAITFGIRERLDCRDWAWFAARRFPDLPLILDGMSLGAATVLMAAAQDLPPAVKGIIADSGYTAPAAIIKKVIQDKHLPQWLIYPLVRWGGRIYGGFDLESCAAVTELPLSRLPLLLIHGEADCFVPCQMSRDNFAASASTNKTLVTVPGADHGFSFLVDRPKVQNAIDAFLNSVLPAKGE